GGTGDHRAEWRFQSAEVDHLLVFTQLRRYTKYRFERIPQPTEGFKSCFKCRLCHAIASLDFLACRVDTEDSLVGLERYAMVFQKPTPHGGRVNSPLFEIPILEFE